MKKYVFAVIMVAIIIYSLTICYAARPGDHVILCPSLIDPNLPTADPQIITKYANGIPQWADYNLIDPDGKIDPNRPLRVTLISAPSFVTMEILPRSPIEFNEGEKDCEGNLIVPAEANNITISIKINPQKTQLGIYSVIIEGDNGITTQRLLLTVRSIPARRPLWMRGHRRGSK